MIYENLFEKELWTYELMNWQFWVSIFAYIIENYNELMLYLEHTLQFFNLKTSVCS